MELYEVRDWVVGLLRLFVLWLLSILLREGCFGRTVQEFIEHLLLECLSGRGREFGTDLHVDVEAAFYFQFGRFLHRCVSTVTVFQPFGQNRPATFPAFLLIPPSRDA